ncbi:RNA-directed DNA polymerase [Labrys monachus]|uniref:Reverse transcriptase domain-containing protein n=1 Tax=Labrys monachus TaxID=217067 RepID=A0ABU0FCJ0_9HYPH|nr:RNA-directed DNA polymerase [Labrys monachus]MDQ0391844.1 hypothetical protein [Labrys monachus]
MRSPRFSLREKELQDLFRPSALKRTWREDIRTKLRERMLPDPIENLDFHVDLDNNCRRISAEICGGTYRPQQPIRVLVEKSKGICRQIALPTVDDSLVLQRLSDALFHSIRGKAPSPSAYFEPDQTRFRGRRFDGPDYGSFAAWLKFKDKIYDMIEVNKFIVVTDIANYYDCIGYVLLRNVISSYISASEATLDLLIFTLDGMLWQPDYMPRVDIGLPQIDLDAPRILAHCFLYDLDAYVTKKGVSYTRYMDDIKLGVWSISEGKSLLRDIDIILHTRHVRLNSGKTIILSATEAIRYFCVDENRRIDKFERYIDRKITGGKPLVKIAYLLSKIIKQIVIRGHFKDGWGEKIVKRLFGLAKIAKANLPLAPLRQILKDRPGCRQAVLDYLASRPLTKKWLDLLRSYIEDPEIVDDAAIIKAAGTIVDMTSTGRRYEAVEIRGISRSIARRGNFGFYAAIWLLSKYGAPGVILSLIEDGYDVWRNDRQFGRMVAGMYPLFLRTKYFDRFETLLTSVSNSGVEEVLDFHRQLSDTLRGAGRIRSILRAKNSSRASGITHSKFLMLISVFHNNLINNKQKEMLVKIHSKAFLDRRYRKLALRSLPPALRVF